MRLRHALVLSTAAALLLPWCAFAEGLWGNPALAPTDPWFWDGRPMDGSSNGMYPQILAGPGGATFLVWSSGGLHAQKLDADGNTLWGESGTLLCSLSNGHSAQVVEDGAGGAVILWADDRVTVNDADVYACRIDADGNVVWGSGNGVVVCNVTSNQQDAQLAGDGAGGAVVVWYDTRHGSSNSDVFAQRLDGATGARLWDPNGLTVCAAANNQQETTVAMLGNSTAVIAWRDFRNSIAVSDIYAQTVNLDGSIPAPWPADGLAICLSGGHQTFPRILAFGSEAVILWHDYRTGMSDLYGQRLTAAGTALWTANGKGLVVEAYEQKSAVSLADGAGGFFLAWTDNRSVPAFPGIRAGRFDGSGNPLWASGGVEVQPDGDVMREELASDGSGGLYITWQDSRSGHDNIYVQRLDGSGQVQWRPGGVCACAAPNNQWNPCLRGAPNGQGAWVFWEDNRAGDDMTFDIYGQYILRPWPRVLSITPNQVYRGKPATAVTFTGDGFATDPGTVAYVGVTSPADGSWIIASNLVVQSDTSLTVDLDVSSTSTALGLWRPIVWDSVGQTSPASAAAIQVLAPSAQQVSWVSALAANLPAGAQDQLTGQLNLTVDGYDRLAAVTVENAGTAEAGTDIAAVDLWLRSGGGTGGLTYDLLPPPQWLGTLSAPPGATVWTLTLSQDVADLDALYFTVDLAPGARAGRTCRFLLPAGGTVFTFAGVLPAAPLLGAYAQTIVRSLSLRLDLQPPAIPTLLTGQPGAVLGHVVLSNVSSLDAALQTLALKLTDAAGQPLRPDAVVGRLWLERDGVTATGILTAPIPEPSELTFTPVLNLTPGETADLTVVADVLAQPFRDTFALGLLDANAVNQGDLPSAPVQTKTFPLLCPLLKIRSADTETLFRSYPNPARLGVESATIQYYVPSQAQVRVELLTLDSRPAALVDEGSRAPGLHLASWNGRNDAGLTVRSGVYLLRLTLTYPDGRRERLERKLAVVR